MNLNHYINQHGFWSEISSGSNTLTIQHLTASSLAPATSSLLVIGSSSSLVGTSTVARSTRHEHYLNAGMTQAVTSSGYTQVAINGAAYTIKRGLASWNTSSNVWFPAENNSVYTLRLEAELPAAGGNNTIQINFCVSGTNPDSPTVAQRLHLVSADYLVRNNVTPHGHFHMVAPVCVDDDLFVSGGIFLASTTAGSITIQSASLMIKEG